MFGSHPCALCSYEPAERGGGQGRVHHPYQTYKVFIKEDAPDKPFTLEGISGKNVFVRYVLACHFAGALHHWILWGI